MELLIGRVIKPHGIRGEVAVEVTTDEPEIRFAGGEELSGRQAGREVSLRIEKTRPHQGRLLVTFEGIDNRTDAESLRGMKFFAPPLETDDGGFYDHELVGLRVIHDGKDIGEIFGINHLQHQSLLEVRLKDAKDVLIPFVHEIVPEVDTGAGHIIITPPEGLLEL